MSEIPEADAPPRSLAPPPLRIRAALATSDPVFAKLCKQAFEQGENHQLVAVPPTELLDVLRQLEPDLLVLDADGADGVALKALAAKAMLVSDARVVLVSAYLAPGSPDLCALLQLIPAGFVQKPQGSSSLSLADEDGPLFAGALVSAFTAAQDEDLVAVDVDTGWDLEDVSDAPSAGGDDD